MKLLALFNDVETPRVFQIEPTLAQCVPRAGSNLALLLLVALALPAWSVRAAETPCYESMPWPEADSIFHQDPHWVGADGAYSIDLGSDRTLWLFGDTWVDPEGQRSRRGAHMIRNSVAIQRGSDPSNASIEFFWKTTADDVPEAFFSRDDESWFWPGHGARIGDRLILFFNRVVSSDTGLGFTSAGWNAMLIENPDDEPSVWRTSLLATPSNSLGVIVGFASVLQSRDYLYAFGSQDPMKSHPIHVARWPLVQAGKGDVREPEWWGGRDVGWVADSAGSASRPVFDDGQSELTIHLDERSREFVAVQSSGFGPADIVIRTASELTGPWSPMQMVYRPPEYAKPNIMIYSAKAHPQLGGAELVLTYSTNSFEFGEHFTDYTIYYPRFVRLRSCAQD